MKKEGVEKEDERKECGSRREGKANLDEQCVKEDEKNNKKVRNRD